MAFDTYDRAIKMKKSFRIEFSLVFDIYKEYTYSVTIKISFTYNRIKSFSYPYNTFVNVMLQTWQKLILKANILIL